MELNILYEDNHIIVVEKPPKVPSQSDPSGDKDMLTLVKEHLIRAYPNTKNPYVAIVHRLDRPVGGIMVFPKTKFACSELNKQIQNKEMQKTYYCVTNGVPEETKGTYIDYLKRIKSMNMSKVVNKGANTAKEAVLNYEVLDDIDDEKEGRLGLLRVELITGRHHQIRVQLSHHKTPLWGDTKYNDSFGRGKRRGWYQIALFAGELSFKHPKTKKQVSFKLDIPNRDAFEFFQSK